ncbi:MAG: hypothetical protein AAF745_03355, partial [Planctomycetota bacterium]
MSRQRFLVLGGRNVRNQPHHVAAASATLGKSATLGWHHQQLYDAAARQAVDIDFADYESISSSIDVDGCTRVELSQSGEASRARSLDDFNTILTRTMPLGSLEQITFRLATLHCQRDTQRIINGPRSLEVAIDKYATLALASAISIPTPRTIVCQSRDAAMDAFERLCGDVVVKPIFGGEGRGVMRVCDRELAWTTFSTLMQLDAVAYVQEFIAPGGSDLRVLV